MALDCHHEGEQKLSFKLGRFVLDVIDEQYTGINPEESVYTLQKDGEAKYRDLTLDNGKYTVKEAKSKVFEEEGKDWLEEVDSDYHRDFYVLDIVVIDAKVGNELYKGEEALEKPTKIKSKKDLGDLDLIEQKPGFLTFDNIKVTNLLKDESKVEVLVHSDLDKDSRWVKILSKKGVKKGDDMALENVSIPCT